MTVITIDLANIYFNGMMVIVAALCCFAVFYGWALVRGLVLPQHATTIHPTGFEMATGCAFVALGVIGFVACVSLIMGWC